MQYQSRRYGEERQGGPTVSENMGTYAPSIGMKAIRRRLHRARNFGWGTGPYMSGELSQFLNFQSSRIQILEELKKEDN